MDDPVVLVTAMAEKCRQVLCCGKELTSSLPAALGPDHLGWMCDQIELHAEDWPDTKLHRWLGFIQAGLLASGRLDLEGAKSMFNDSKIAHTTSKDELTDHLDPGNPYEIDLGGES